MSAPAPVDLSGDGKLTVIDGLLWFATLSGLGLGVLLLSGAVFTAVLWTTKGTLVGVVAIWRGIAAGARAVVAAVRSAGRSGRLRSRPRSHHA